MENMFEYSGEDVVLPTEVYSEAALKDIQDLQDGINEGWDYIETCDGYSNELCSDTTLDEIVFINAGLEHISDRLDMVHVPAKIDMMRAMPNRMTRASVEGVGSGIKKAAIATYRAIRNTLRKLGRFIMRYVNGLHRVAQRLHKRASGLLDEYKGTTWAPLPDPTRITTDSILKQFISTDSGNVTVHVDDMLSMFEQSVNACDYIGEMVVLEKLTPTIGDPESSSKEVLEAGRNFYTTTVEDLWFELNSKPDSEDPGYDHYVSSKWWGNTSLNAKLIDGKDPDRMSTSPMFTITHTPLEPLSTVKSLDQLDGPSIITILEAIHNSVLMGDLIHEVGDIYNEATDRMVAIVDEMMDVSAEQGDRGVPTELANAYTSIIKSDQKLIKSLGVDVLKAVMTYMSTALDYVEESAKLHKYK